MWFSARVVYVSDFAQRGQELGRVCIRALVAGRLIVSLAQARDPVTEQDLRLLEDKIGEVARFDRSGASQPPDIPNERLDERAFEFVDWVKCVPDLLSGHVILLCGLARDYECRCAQTMLERIAARAFLTFLGARAGRLRGVRLVRRYLLIGRHRQPR